VSSHGERLQSVFAAILKRPVRMDEDISREAEKGWDSLKHMELVFALEEEFGVEFSEEDIGRLDSRAAFAARIAEMT
jgi:acyl carrier protein